ncbi:MAG: transposase, partial [Polyangiaceae bacterium]|nr:transposase [Polyangiaceae bacterium]
MKAVHAKGAYFVTKAKMDQKLCCAINTHTDWQTIEEDDDRMPLVQIAELQFRRVTWDTDDALPVRVIAIRRKEGRTTNQYDLWESDGWKTQVFLTNDMYEDNLHLVNKYNGRAGIEPMIAEAKNSWGAEAMSSSAFYANAATFLLKLLAHNLLRE